MPPRINADKSQQLEAAILEQAAAIFQIERKLVAAKASVAELAVAQVAFVQR